MNTLPEADRRCAERAWMDRHDTAPTDTIDRYLEAQGLSVECRWDGRYRQRFRDLADAYWRIEDERIEAAEQDGAIQRECPTCGTTFPVQRHKRSRKYCSPECYENDIPQYIDRNLAICKAVNDLLYRGWKPMEAYRQTADKYELTDAHVRHIVGQYRRGEDWAQDIEEAA